MKIKYHQTFVWWYQVKVAYNSKVKKLYFWFKSNKKILACDTTLTYGIEGIAYCCATSRKEEDKGSSRTGGGHFEELKFVKNEYDNFVKLWGTGKCQDTVVGYKSKALLQPGHVPVDKFLLKPNNF